MTMTSPGVGEKDTHGDSVDWPSFTEKLADVLGSLEEDQFLILNVKGTNRFVQFSAQGDNGMRAETTSNSYLSGVERLNADQIAALHTLGWYSPTGSPAESTPDLLPDGSPNFYTHLWVPVSFKDVAKLAVQTLTEVLQVPHPGFLEYQAFDEYQTEILLPTLELEQAAPRSQAKDTPGQPDQLLETMWLATGNFDLAYHQDGYIVFPHGSILVYAQLMPKPVSVSIFSPLLVDVVETPALLSKLNEMNASAIHVRFYHHDSTIFVQADIAAEPFDGTHVANVFGHFCRVAEGIDTGFQAAFGGKSVFDAAPSEPAKT